VRRRKAWNGKPPRTPAEARRFLLDVARDCVERFGLSKASLSDVAEAAGVTRQTVYRYFENADDLFQSAAVLASGGFHQRLRQRVLARHGHPHLSALVKSGDHFTVSSALRLFFVQDEMIALAEGDMSLSARDRDELSEILLRMLHSFLSDPGEARTEDELRAFLYRWLVPMIEEKLNGSGQA
jgi:AcrR family transcriptional regulator